MTPAPGEVLGESRMQSEAVYIGCSQGAVAQWVPLISIFEVSTREHVYEGQRLRRNPWWRQEAPDVILRETLEDISREARITQRRRYNQ